MTMMVHGENEADIPIAQTVSHKESQAIALARSGKTITNIKSDRRRS